MSKKIVWKIIMYVYMIFPTLLTLGMLIKYTIYGLYSLAGAFDYNPVIFIGEFCGSILATVGLFGWLPYKYFFKKRIK